MKRRTFVQYGLASLGSLALNSHADDKWPSKTITYVVPLAAGGATDTAGRLISQQLSSALGVSVIVENKPGAGGSIGTEYVARAPADGYTLVGGSISTHAINVSLYPKLGYDPIKSFTPIAMIGVNPLVLVVPQKSPYKSLQDILKAAKAKPQSITYASAGNGTSMHMAVELLSYKSGAQFTHVPYKGSNPALKDVIAGEVDMLFDTAIAAGPHIESGRLRALAVGTKERLDFMPDLPTVVEAGVSDFEVSSWLAIFARSGTDQAIVDRLHEEISKILRSEEMQKRLKSMGSLPVQMTPAQLAAFQKAEVDKWAQVIKAAGITLS